MKRFFSLLILAIAIVTTNAQVTPIIEFSPKNYDEVIVLIKKMENISKIEQMEGIKLSSKITTYYDNFIIERNQNSIMIFHNEYYSILNKSIDNLNQVRSELLIQNTNLYKYIVLVISGNENIKSITIEVDPITKASYIQVSYYKL